MEIKLKTLTPIWTGGVDGNMDRLHETGIIGSLRWWYEAIVRGLGGRACDPTQSSCGYDPDKPNNGLCDACQLFGATGWRRRFRLIVDDSGLSESWAGGGINIKPPGRSRGWYLNAGKMGSFGLRIIADEQTQAKILALLQFVARWGSVGTRPQLGYGVFKIVEIKNQPMLSYNWDDIGNSQNDESLPNLRQFTFFVLDFEPQQDNWWQSVPGLGAILRKNRTTLDSLIRHRTIPITPTMRNVLRYGEAWSSNALPHQFFGTLRGNERSRSKIAMSWAYKQADSSTWQIRGWAYPPHGNKKHQQEIQQRLQAVLGKPEACLRALKIRYRWAEISIAPHSTFFMPITSSQLQNFICEVQR